MTGHKAIFGFCALCAVLLGTVAAQSASAVSQTAVTCATTGTQIGGTEKFADEHCKEKKSTGPRYHVAFTEATFGELTNNTTGTGKEPFYLRATIGGLETIIEAKTVAAFGLVWNLESGGEMYAEFETGTIKFTEVSVVNRSCEFVGRNPNEKETAGSVETQPIEGSTLGQAKGVLKFVPQAGPTAKLAEFTLLGASCPAALTGVYPVYGTVLSNAAEGTTVPTAHGTVTGEPAPKLRLKNATEGPLAGLDGKVTMKGEPVSGGGLKPIALT